MKPFCSLTFPEQVVIYTEFDNMPDSLARAMFTVTQQELFAIKTLASERFHAPSVGLDVEEYREEIEWQVGRHHTPRFATRKVKQRGRPGLNIIKAFAMIPTGQENRVDAEMFAHMHEVSLSTLKQHTRFDKTRIPGKVTVKKDKGTDNLMVWRKAEDE